MKRPWAVLLRSLAIQGSWNYETLSGAGFAFAALPALRRLYPDQGALDAAVQRHATTFNSHPYLAPLALGAVLRMESDGEDPELIERFKAALRGTLGTLGDQLVWTAWRPFCMITALAALLLGAPWWSAILLFLLVYNLGHLVLMFWSFSVGLEEGRGVAERIRSSALRQTIPRLKVMGAFVTGLALAAALARGLPGIERPDGVLWMILAAAGAAAGAWRPDATRRVAVWAVVAAIVVAVAWGALA